MSLRTRFFLLVAAGAIATATTAYLLHFRFLDNLERQTIDLRFSLRGDEAPPKDVVIVKVDDVTFSDHKEWRWPFDRKIHAQTLDQIRKGHPKAVAFDIQFCELGSVAGDNALGYALLRNHGKTALATTEVTKTGEPNLIFNPAALKQLGARAGNANLPTDPDGIIRRFPFDVEGIEGLRDRRRRDRRGQDDHEEGNGYRTCSGSTTPDQPGTITRTPIHASTTARCRRACSRTRW